MVKTYFPHALALDSTYNYTWMMKREKSIQGGDPEHIYAHIFHVPVPVLYQWVTLCPVCHLHEKWVSGTPWRLCYGCLGQWKSKSSTHWKNWPPKPSLWARVSGSRTFKNPLYGMNQGELAELWERNRLNFRRLLMVLKRRGWIYSIGRDILQEIHLFVQTRPLFRWKYTKKLAPRS